MYQKISKIFNLETSFRPFYIFKETSAKTNLRTSDAKTQNKYSLLNNLKSKHSLVMKFGRFMFYFKRKILSKNST